MATETSKAWGNPDRHYSAAPTLLDGGAVSARRRPAPLPRGGVWEELLETANPGLKATVERVCKQWNTILRDYMRTETGLRLTVGEESQSVPVRVVDGMPSPFAAIARRFEGLEWALLNRPALIAARDGTAFMVTHYDSAYRRWGEKAGPATQVELVKASVTAAAWLKELDATKAVDAIVGIEEDVLGAYFFRRSEIQLYWLVIGMVSAMLGVPAEALAVVVLTHELAHAYTHLGRDIDNERWDTEAFAAAHLDIVEGLAQFYTQVICKRLEPRMPAALAAYTTLLAFQSDPYKAHEKWVGTTERGGEIVRVSMIECRSRKITAAAEFADAVRKHRVGVKGRVK